MDMQEREITSKTKTITDILGCNRLDLGFEVYYNNYGHLVLRWYNMANENKDFVISLDPNETLKVITLIKAFPVVSR